MLNRVNRRGFIRAALAQAGVMTLALSLPGGTVAAREAAAQTDPDTAGTRFPGPTNLPRFLVGANYEGPADRQWEMWKDERWDPDLIRADFENAVSLDLHALRIFIQSPLDREIRRKRWNKIDTLVSMARRQKLLLYVSLGDYDEPDLAQRAVDYELLTTHLAKNPTILCYDLRNELSFRQLLFTRFPDGPNPLQGPDLMNTYGEKVTLADIATRREQDPKWLPDELVAPLADNEIYFIGNSLAIYEELIGSSWYYIDTTNDANTIDWLAQPDVIARWGPALSLLDGLLTRWITPLIAAVRRGDSVKPITLDHNDLILASRPPNQQLDFLSLHAYPTVDTTFPPFLANQLQQYSVLHGKPALLGEFGWSTAEAMDEVVAGLESSTLAELRGRGLIGAFKWMLNDVEGGEEGREGSFGLFNARGNRKPGAYVWREAAQKN